MVDAKRKSKKGAKKKAKKKRKIQAYVFIDTNIFLDFYRANNEASLAMLEKLEKVQDRVICTYQVEMEFLKNRQSEICKIVKQYDLSISANLPAVLSDTQLSTSVRKIKLDLKSKRETLQANLRKILQNPKHDRVYNVLENVFQSDSDHVLTRDMKIKNRIKRLARRRFQLGYPPRKHDDTSMGDAINWEWIIHCASRLKGRIVILSRDSDFGCQYNKEYFLNDQLRREFRERVGKKSLVYTQKLSEALEYLDVPVTARERKSEAAVFEAAMRNADRFIRFQQSIEALSNASNKARLAHLENTSLLPPSYDEIFADRDLWIGGLMDKWDPIDD